MTGLVLANASYRRWMTDEGEQFQRGLEAAGWTLAGRGYGDARDGDPTDVPTLLERHAPDAVVVQPPIDWGRDRFARAESLAHVPLRYLVVRDPVTSVHAQAEWARLINPTALVSYYRLDGCYEAAPWLRDWPHVRTYHTVDAEVVSHLDFVGERRRGVVSGALGPAYPLRELAFREAEALGLDALPHPGYTASGPRTADYLRALSGYRVSVATASRYGLALRKIVESVAAGCSVVTSLLDDTLPEIERGIVRVVPSIDVDGLRWAIDAVDAEWNSKESAQRAYDCAKWYDWRAMGARLSAELLA